MGGGDREQNMRSYFSIKFQGPAVTGKERVGTVSVNSLSFLRQSKTQLKAENRAGGKVGGEAIQKLERTPQIIFCSYYLGKKLQQIPETEFRWNWEREIVTTNRLHKINKSW